MSTYSSLVYAGKGPSICPSLCKDILSFMLKLSDIGTPETGNSRPQVDSWSRHGGCYLGVKDVDESKKSHYLGCKKWCRIFSCHQKPHKHGPGVVHWLVKYDHIWSEIPNCVATCHSPNWQLINTLLPPPKIACSKPSCLEKTSFNDPRVEIQHISYLPGTLQ